MMMKERITDICDALCRTLIKKNDAYGNSASKSLVFCPNIGTNEAILVRMSDKVSRISNLLTNNVGDNGESLNDSILDLAGYCVLYLANNSKSNNYEGIEND